METGRRVVVVGGGISGLSAAWRLAESTEAPEVVLLESSPQVGGKIRTGELAGVPVEDGAESLLARRPEAVDLVRSAGLADRQITPATHRAWLLTTHGLRALPPTFLGIPGDPEALAKADIVAADVVKRIAAEGGRSGPSVLAAGADAPIGTVVRSRFGDAVLDDLVEPLLGGVYAGRADALSIRATMPDLSRAAEQHSSLLRSVQAVMRRAVPDPAPVQPPAPVFVGLAGGLGQLPAALARHPGVDVRTRATVRAIRRAQGGAWEVEYGPTADPVVLRADALVLAVPGMPLRRLLGPVSAQVAGALSGLSYASVGLVALAYPAGVLGDLPGGSGYLVPPRLGRPVKAVTFVSRKWPWVADAVPGVELVRASVGRIGEVEVLQRDDDDLVDLVVDDLVATLGPGAAAPLARRVSRWGGALPQYQVGHLDRVDSLRRALADMTGVVVAGAAVDGVGIAACVASGREAAGVVLRHLATHRDRAGATMNGTNTTTARGT